MIFCANPQAQYIAYQKDIDQVIARVLAKGHYILGEEVRLFEEELARSIAVPHAIGVSSATEALHIALKACGVGPGDEVITVSHTAVATVAAIALTGATAVLVDIDPEMYTMEPQCFREAVTSRTKAVVVVHLYGHPADMTEILKIARANNIRVIEDCSQAQGAVYNGQRVGSMGDLAAFSFYPTKNLGAIGDGGAVTAQDAGLADRCRQLREYGWSKDRVSQIPGWNSRLDELQAAVLRVKLPKLDEDNAKRRAIAQEYQKHLSSRDLVLPQVGSKAEHVYHLYVVRSKNRDGLKKHLADRGVQTMIHYAYPAHRHPGFQSAMRVAGELKHTEEAVRNILSLPMYPQLGSKDLSTVIDAVQTFTG